VNHQCDAGAVPGEIALVVDDSSLEERQIADAVRAVRAGNAQAYATIVAQFQEPMMTLCVALLRDRQAAEELAQDVFVQAYRRLDTFDAQRPMKPWLGKIAYHLARQRWRSQNRQRAREKTAAALIDRNRSEPEPPDLVVVEEQSEILWQTVYALPLAQRTAVVLYYRENLTVEEVADAMDVSSGAVKQHLFRARTQIRNSLHDQGFSEGETP
jgi:RNA polymerase sigma-70 factor (ECF subfamily)